MPEPKLYLFSTFIGAAWAKQFRTFSDLAEKLKMDVTDLTRQPRRNEQCNGKAPPSRALAKGLAWALEIDESSLEKLADEVRKDLRAK